MRRNSPVSIDGAFARIISNQRFTYFTVLLQEKLAHQTRPGLDVLGRIAWIRAERLGRLRRQLYHADSPFSLFQFRFSALASFLLRFAEVVFFVVSCCFLEFFRFKRFGDSCSSYRCQRTFRTHMKPKRRM
jgi:hypothetical protein